ncbi:hypothetical protein Tco_0122437 [Tanacetum coccineum]
MIVEKQLLLEMFVDESPEMIVDESLEMIEDESLDMIVDEPLMVEDKSLEKLVDETLKLDEEHFESVIADCEDLFGSNQAAMGKFIEDVEGVANIADVVMFVTHVVTVWSCLRRTCGPGCESLGSIYVEVRCEGYLKDAGEINSMYNAYYTSFASMFKS